ncbi:MAG TPA: hypothetical protein VJZ00_22045, partial [Thermoanaerobaculia bacterium]|nr:hypothetical protein [Thermoanaerobaculia bacterium]
MLIDLPEGVAFDRIFSIRNQCDVSVKPVRCSLGDPASRDVIPILVRAIAPIANRTVTMSVRAVSDAQDPDSTNNTATSTFTVQVATALYVGFNEPHIRVDPGTVFKTPFGIGNNLHISDPGHLRLHLDIVGGGTIEQFEPLPSWSCTTTATSVDCALPPLTGECMCAIGASISVRAPDSRAGGEVRIVPTITSDLPNVITRREPKIAEIYRWIAVTNTADAGPGSLRDAITEANTTCGDAPCRIAFEIATPVPNEGWFTIVPSTPLPAVTAKRVFLDAARQTVFSGDTNPLGPEVAIDGRVAGSGLAMMSGCESVVTGLALGNFMSDQGLRFAATGDYNACALSILDRLEVFGNHIGVDPTGGVAWPNLRGLRLDGALGDIHDNVISRNRYSGIWRWGGGELYRVLRIRRNRIESNGASGILLAFANT